MQSREWARQITIGATQVDREIFWISECQTASLQRQKNEGNS